MGVASESSEWRRWPETYVVDLSAAVNARECLAGMLGRAAAALCGYRYVILALFKLARVLEGSNHRLATGKSTDPMHEKVAPLVLTLTEQPVEVVRTRLV